MLVSLVRLCSENNYTGVDFLQNFKSKFENAFSDVLFDEPMKKHTTFKIGGNADVFISPKNVDEVK